MDSYTKKLYMSYLPENEVQQGGTETLGYTDADHTKFLDYCSSAVIHHINKSIGENTIELYDYGGYDSDNEIPDKEEAPIEVIKEVIPIEVIPIEVIPEEVIKEEIIQKEVKEVDPKEIDIKEVDPKEMGISPLSIFSYRIKK